MINYQQKDDYIVVKWKKTQIGRIYHEESGWVYKPRGCEGKIVSEAFPKLSQLKQHLEGDGS